MSHSSEVIRNPKKQTMTGRFNCCAIVMHKAAILILLLNVAIKAEVVSEKVTTKAVSEPADQSEDNKIFRDKVFKNLQDTFGNGNDGNEEQEARGSNRKIIPMAIIGALAVVVLMVGAIIVASVGGPTTQSPQPQPPRLQLTVDGQIDREVTLGQSSTQSQEHRAAAGANKTTMTNPYKKPAYLGYEPNQNTPFCQVNLDEDKTIV